MIPEGKKEVVARALKEAFGTTEFQAINEMSAGFTSTLVFQIEVNGCPYVLRVCTRTDGRNEPTRQFQCMKIAADAGLAPRVWYTNVEDRVSIIGFVDGKQLPVANAVVPVADALRALHALPPFPKLTNNFDTAPTFLLRPSPLRDGFLQKFQADKILPDADAADLFPFYERLRAAYPWDGSELVSSHNDLKPPNMVFDGNRIWLIDWEAAFLNDRYNDLAVMANFVISSDADEEAYLKTYFGGPADEYQRARFYLMRQIVHMFYAMVFINLGAAGKPIDPSIPLPAFKYLHDQIWIGEVTLESSDRKVEFGRVHLKQVLQNARSARLQESMRIVSGRGAAA